jgi:hypothetical protein
MAEPSERPVPAPTGGAQPAPESYTARRPAPPPSFARDGAGEPEYRPLSVAALVGFGLAVLFAAGLILSALAAWFTGLPLPLALWALLVPLAALAVSGVGWLRVQQSEGTLAGGKLALWGVLLSLFAGLSYGAYLAATYVALGREAEAFATQWLEKIREGKVDEAFVEALPLENRPRPGPNLHAELELRFNTGRGGGFHGELTAFEHGDVMRAIRTAGSAVTIRPLGVKGFESKSNGCEVETTFEITTPERVMEVQVAVVGMEGKVARQWFVHRGKTRSLRMMDQPLGRRTAELRLSSYEFVGDWLHLLQAGAIEEAYLRTQPPGRRSALRAEVAAGVVGATLAPEFGPARPVPMTSPAAARQLYLPGYAAFTDGGVIQVAPNFWAQGPLREEIPAQVREMFRRADDPFPPTVLLDQPTTLPLWDRQGDRVRFYHGFEGQIKHRYIIQGACVAEADARVLDDPALVPDWQLKSIELYNGRTMASQPGR